MRAATTMASERISPQASKPRLLVTMIIVDEIGYLPLERQAAVTPAVTAIRELGGQPPVTKRIRTSQVDLL